MYQATTDKFSVHHTLSVFNMHAFPECRPLYAHTDADQYDMTSILASIFTEVYSIVANLFGIHGTLL